MVGGVRHWIASLTVKPNLERTLLDDLETAMQDAYTVFRGVGRGRLHPSPLDSYPAEMVFIAERVGKAVQTVIACEF